MAPVHRAIQTHYAGCHFRSRLEARWAVFFDELGIRWDYEPEGIEIFQPSDSVPDERYGYVSGPDLPPWRYLPDFYLPDLKCWVEVKGDWSNVSPTYWEMLAFGIDWGGPLSQGLLLLGPIPRGSRSWSRGPGHKTFHYPLHTMLYNDKAICGKGVSFLPDGSLCDSDIWPCLDNYDAYMNVPDLLGAEIMTCEGAYQDMHQHPKAIQFPSAGAAYDAARSARFEHGQRGAR